MADEEHRSKLGYPTLDKEALVLKLIKPPKHIKNNQLDIDASMGAFIDNSIFDISVSTLDVRSMSEGRHYTYISHRVGFLSHQHPRIQIRTTRVPRLQAGTPWNVPGRTLHTNSVRVHINTKCKRRANMSLQPLTAWTQIKPNIHRHQTQRH